MPLLAYCIAEVEEAAGVATTFAEGLQSKDIDGLRVFFSPYEAREIPTAEIEKRALEFHRQVKAIFTTMGVIPFRFPTLIEDEAKLQEHIEENAARYRTGLKRTQGMVQMDVRVGVTEPEPAQSPASRSGAEYLKEKADSARKLESAITAVREAAADVVVEWKRRQEKQGLRGFLLVPRDKVEAFKQRASSARLGPGLRVMVSGPWPATEFLEEQNQ